MLTSRVSGCRSEWRWKPEGSWRELGLRWALKCMRLDLAYLAYCSRPPGGAAYRRYQGSHSSTAVKPKRQVASTEGDWLRGP
eukprot:2290737-Prymnesium_polylepis.1